MQYFDGGKEIFVSPDGRQVQIKKYLEGDGVECTDIQDGTTHTYDYSDLKSADPEEDLSWA